MPSTPIGCCSSSSTFTMLLTSAISTAAWMAKHCCIQEPIFNIPKAVPCSNISKEKQIEPHETRLTSLPKEINTASSLNTGGCFIELQTSSASVFIWKHHSSLPKGCAFGEASASVRRLNARSLMAFSGKTGLLTACFCRMHPAAPRPEHSGLAAGFVPSHCPVCYIAPVRRGISWLRQIHAP